MESVRHYTILLADDTEAEIDLALEVFRRSGSNHDIGTFRDGSEVLQYIEHCAGTRQKMPGLILLDLNMPGLGGIETLRHLRNSTTSKDLPVVIMSTSTRDRDFRAAYDAGATSYIIKDPDFDKFERSLARAVQFWTRLSQ